MPAFRVTSIIDGDTIEVSPEWKWNCEAGTRVRPAGYHAPELYTAIGQKAKDALSKLINGLQVELSTTYKVDRGRLVCEVFDISRNLAEFFPKYLEIYEIETSKLMRRIIHV